MKIRTMTINMVLAALSNVEPDKQVVKMATRYRNKCITPSTKRTLKRIMTSPKPALLVCSVYHEIIVA